MFDGVGLEQPLSGAEELPNPEEVEPTPGSDIRAPEASALYKATVAKQILAPVSGAPAVVVACVAAAAAFA